jgi:Asp-tRNA(Asn)/Glu-tRNA(Gln) amidotransferase A subunit family amidase
MDELHELSAAEALTRFRARELSPVELMEAVIARRDAVEPTVNALCFRHDEDALAQAREAEARYAGRGGEPRPLEGIPVAIKDEEPVAGRPLTSGSLVYAEQVSDHDSPVSRRIGEAGGILHARTTTPEFCCAGFTHSRLWGVTRNPWSPEYAVGGSSGGSAAALASGTALLATGSDIGGSIRIPASFCGVVGFKPPYGRNAQDPPFNLDTYCHVGPLARTVADTALLQNVLAGPDPVDAVSLRPKLEIPAELQGIAGLRVAVSHDLGDWPVDPEVRANTRAAADALRAAGAVVEEVELHMPRADVMRAMAIHFHHGFAAYVSELAVEHADEMTAYALDFPRWCEELAAGGSILEGWEIEARVQGPLSDVLERYDAVLCPTIGTTGLIAGEDYVERAVEVDGQALGTHLESMLTAPFNVASRCPVLSLPSGVASNGVPTGVQVVGRTYDDVTVFRVGAALERERPWERVAPAQAVA